jgi:3,4-dihydroxy 2-butanone 4-phosphate synthase/GTP cyclohydrolase II
MNGPVSSPAREGRIIEQLAVLLKRAAIDCSNRHLPFVTLTYAQSLDGSIARCEGDTLQLSNPLAQELTHQVRALHDAILVGINTVICDDPRLTVRLVEGKNPQPVVVDSQMRIPLQARLFREGGLRPIIIADSRACSLKERSLLRAGARVIRVPAHGTDGMIDLEEGLRQLKQLGLNSIMIEGGARIITSVLSRRLADQLLLTISPRFVGGLRAVGSNNESDGDRWPQLRNVQYQWLAGDLILRGDLGWGEVPKRNCLPAAHRSQPPGHWWESKGVEPR